MSEEPAPPAASCRATWFDRDARVPVTVAGPEVVYGLRTTLLRTTLERAGQNVSQLRFQREIDVATSTSLKP